MVPADFFVELNGVKLAPFALAAVRDDAEVGRMFERITAAGLPPDSRVPTLTRQAMTSYHIRVGTAYSYAMTPMRALIADLRRFAVLPEGVELIPFVPGRHNPLAYAADLVALGEVERHELADAADVCYGRAGELLADPAAASGRVRRRVREWLVSLHHALPVRERLRLEFEAGKAAARRWLVGELRGLVDLSDEERSKARRRRRRPARPTPALHPPSHGPVAGLDRACVPR